MLTTGSTRLAVNQGQHSTIPYVTYSFLLCNSNLSVLLIYPRFLCVCSVCIVAFFVFVLFCYNLMHVRCFGLVVNTCPPPSVWPHLFCGADHEKRRGEQLKWSLAFRLYIGSFPCAQLPEPVHTSRLGRVCFYI